MYVCICNAITENQIRYAAQTGVRDLWQLQRELGVASSCGSCKEHAIMILNEAHTRQAPAQPATYRPNAA